MGNLKHGNYHQSGFDDEGEWWDTPGANDPGGDDPLSERSQEFEPDADDLAWYESFQRSTDTADIDRAPTSADTCVSGAVQQRWPSAFRPPGGVH